MDNNRHFTLVVIGENHEELVKKYDSSIKGEPHIQYRFSDRDKYHQYYVTLYENLLLNETDEHSREILKETLDFYKEIDDVDFYLQLTEGLEIDENTGDAVTSENPNGRYDSCKIGKNLSLPLITKDGNETFSALKGEIDWSKVHLSNKEVYESAWEIVMEGRVPKNDQETLIYENMKNRTHYFEFFGNKENYVSNSTAFWGYAVLDKDGWHELGEKLDQIEWVKTFYDTYIKNLPDNERVTIYECFRK